MEQLRSVYTQTLSTAPLLIRPLVTLIGIYKATLILNSIRNFMSKFIFKKIFGFNEKALKDKEWILVTGATSGIGRSIVDELAKLKKGIVVVGRDQNKLDALESYFQSINHTKYIILKVDLAELHSVPHEMDKWIEIFAKLPKIDLVINNAGTSPKCRIVTTKYEDIVEAFNTNVMSILFITNAYLGHKLTTKEEGGHLLFVSSAYSLLPVPYSSCYPMNKHFGSHYYSALEKKLRKVKSSVKLTYVNLGRVITPMNIVMFENYQKTGPDVKKKLGFGVLLPETAAKAILFQSLNEVESYGHPNHYLLSTVAEFVYGMFGRVILRPIAKAKLQYLLEREKANDIQ